MPQLDRNADLFVLDLGGGENRINPDWAEEVLSLLGEVERAEGPRALVTAATGKFWSNGLDLDWAGRDADRFRQLIDAYEPLLARVLTLSVPTVAAIQGHAYAGGALLALAHDHRVMRADRGFFCLPEVAIGLPFSPGMSALATAKLSPQTARDAMMAGRRYGGADALAGGIIDAAVDQDEVLPRARAIAEQLTDHAGKTLGRIKATMYPGAVAGLGAGDG